MTIPNRISLALVAGFLVFAPLSGMGLAETGWHLAAFALVLACTFALFALRVFGGGDAKLIAATALWMGWGAPLMAYLFHAAIAGGLLAALLLVTARLPIAQMAGGRRLPPYLVDPRKGVPYGIALGWAGLAAFPQTPFGQAAFAAFF